MITVWKYPVPPEAKFTLNVPKGARFLCAQAQNGEPQMWFAVDTEAETEEQQFFIGTTGNPNISEILDPSKSTHLGSVLLNHETLVFHIFKVH